MYGVTDGPRGSAGGRTTRWDRHGEPNAADSGSCDSRVTMINIKVLRDHVGDRKGRGERHARVGMGLNNVA